MRQDAPIVAQAWRARLCRALVVGFGLFATSSSAFAEAKAPIRVSIAAQPLATALDAYSAVFGIEIFYDGELAIGRRSISVDGLLTADAALRELLAGSGLVARASGPTSFIVAAAPSMRVADVTQQVYFAAIQARVSQVLCARQETRPGDTDRLLQLWIGPSGIVQRAQWLDESDDRHHSDAFATSLLGISIGVAAPQAMPQPVTMAILARAPGEPTGCPSGAARAER